VQTTATPAPTPGPYATLAPASTRHGDVRSLATGGGASAIAYWPDYNVVVVGDGPQVIDAADGSLIASTPDTNSVTAVAYSPSNHNMYFATATDVYSFAHGGPVLTFAVGLQHVASLAVANDGTVYAIDTDHIVKISGGLSTNLTAPGSIGAFNYYGDYPSMVFANDGTLLVSDPVNDVIDRVTTSGSITPFAGGCKAASGGFTGTNGSCWHLAQAGTGSSANFGMPTGLAYDSTTGTLYVSDTQNNQLWSVSSTGAATPVAGYGAQYNADGNGLAAFLYAPTSLAFQPPSHSVDVLESAQAGQQEIVAYTADGTAAPAYTPPTMPVYFPNGLAISELAAAPDGSAWAADSNQRNVVRVSSSGTVTRYALPSGTSTTWHNTVDANGNAFFLAGRLGTNGISQDNGVLEVTPAGVETYVAAQPQHSGANSISMEALTIGPDGNPWFTESETWMYGGSYGFVNSSTHAITQYALSTAPNGISQAPGGELAIETQVAGNPGIAFASTTGQITASYPAAQTAPNSLKYRASDQSIWFTDAMSIDSMASNGTLQKFSVCGSCGPLNLTVAPDGSVWSDGSYPGAITRLTPSGNVSYYLLPISYGPTYGISARSDGKLWVYNSFGVLYLFDPAAYDAMNGPHVVQGMSRRANSMCVGWHRW
jgi:streptogramin lyase